MIFQEGLSNVGTGWISTWWMHRTSTASKITYRNSRNKNQFFVDPR